MRKQTAEPADQAPAIGCTPVVIDNEALSLEWIGQTYRTLVESISEGVLVISAGGAILYANRAVGGMIDRQSSDLLGSSILDLAPSDMRMALEELIARCADGSCNGELTLTRPSPKPPIPVGISFSPLAFGDIPAIGVVVTDLTERKAHAEQLRQHRDHLEELVETRTKDLRATQRQLEASKDTLQVCNLELESAYEALSIERANLQRVFAAANVGLLVVDGQGGIVRVNDTVSEWVGKDAACVVEHQPGDALGCVYAVGDPAGCGHTAHCASCPIRNTFETTLRTGRAVHGVEANASLVVGESKVQVWLDISADPLLVDGEPHVVLALNNITERKQSEVDLARANEELLSANEELRQEVRWRKAIQSDLQETSDYLESLIDYANAPIIVWDQYFRITRFNRAAEILSGYKADEALGQQLRMLFPEESREDSFDRIQAALQGEYLESVEIPILRKDNSVRVALWNSANIHRPDGPEPVATIAQGQDITDRKLAEAEVLLARADAERHAAELGSFIYSIADGVVLLNADGEITYANDACLRLFGIHPGESFSERFDQFERYDENGNLLPKERWAALQGLNGVTLRDVYQRMVSPEGKEIAVSVSASPVYGPRGTVIGATAAFRDVGERVELEKHREELYQREHHIADVLQQALIPSRSSYSVPGSKVAVRYQPALKEAEVGGDFYDIFQLEENLWGLLIGDVAGKGLRAAMRVAAARHAVRSYAFLDPDPAQVLTLANAALTRDDSESGAMLTVFFAVLDTTAYTLTYASAGHEPPVIVDMRGIIHELEATGIPLGVLDDAQYTEGSHKLKPGDTLLMMTDGITEARSFGVGLFGKQGVVEFLESNISVDPHEIASGLLEAAMAHAGGKLQDDAAIVAIVLRDDAANHQQGVVEPQNGYEK